MAKIAVYGSLRIGQYNHESFKKTFGEDSIKHLGKAEIPDYTILVLDNIGYPFAVPCEGKSCVVDLFEVSTPAFSSINSMEIGAGYLPTVINIDDEEFVFYEYKNAKLVSDYVN